MRMWDSLRGPVTGTLAGLAGMVAATMSAMPSMAETPPQVQAQTAPAEQSSPSPTGQTAPAPEDAGKTLLNIELPTRDVLLIQRCFAKNNFYRGPLTGKLDKETWTAYWRFRKEYNAPREKLFSQEMQQRLFVTCRLYKEDNPRLVVVEPDPPPEDKESKSGDAQVAVALPDRPGPDTVRPRPEPKVYAKPQLDCLASDLYKIIVDNYGPRPQLNKCDNACVPMPQTLSPQEAADYEKKSEVNWCKACVSITGHLPLEDIEKLEDASGLQICTTPPTRIPQGLQQKQLAGTPYTRVRELYRGTPHANENPNLIAVLIGNRHYANDIPHEETAANDASAMYALLTEQLGVRADRIIDVRDATLEQMNRIFGTSAEPKGELSKLMGTVPNPQVLVYYAGRGASNADQSDAYLLPVDAVEYREDRTAYSLSSLFQRLLALKPKKMMLLLETDFGRDQSDFIFAPNLPDMWVRTIPEKPHPELTVITAADRDQKTLDDPRYGIGLFTRYLIEGLSGKADIAPIGDGDGAVDVIELYVYVSHEVRLAARKSFGLLQKPLISSAGADVWAKYDVPAN